MPKEDGKKLSTKLFGSHKWPKTLPALSDDQRRIRADFQQRWLEVLPGQFGLIEQFNHRYPLRRFSTEGKRTLEIGAGLGAHLAFEKLDAQEYTVLELSAEMAERLQSRFPQVRVIVGDCQKKSDFSDGAFDRVLAIHVLEHLPDMPRAIDEVFRVLRPDGMFFVLIPCEGGLAYSVARNISARRIFERRYHQSYDWFVESEHINSPEEIVEGLRSRFRIIHRQYFPLPVPIVPLNLVIGLTLKPRKS